MDTAKTPAEPTPRAPLRIVARLISAAMTLYLVVVGAACVLQRKLIYYPSPGPVAVPESARAAGLEEVDLRASDGVALKAWHWPGERPLTLLVLHGNAGNRGHRFPWMQALRRTGAGVFVLDYRGYGGSEGSPTEDGLYRDAEAAAGWLEAHGAGAVVYLGESLGTGVAVELALRRPPAALVLQGAFTSLVDVAQGAYPFLPVRLLLRDRFDSISKMERVACPVLEIHGERDSLIPAAQGKALLEKARTRKERLEVPGADHNDALWDDPSYLPRLSAFLGLTRE